MQFLKIANGFSSVRGEPWKAPAFVVGGGPSLKGFDFKRLKDLGHTIAVKQSIYYTPWADAVVSLDRQWNTDNKDYLSKLSKTQIYIVVRENSKVLGQIPNAHYVREYQEKGFSDDPARLAYLGTSGLAAFNLAYLKRPPEIYLLGFDMDTGRAHFHDDYKDSSGRENQTYYSSFPHQFKRCIPQLQAAGIKVINCYRGSAIRCFEFGSYADI